MFTAGTLLYFDPFYFKDSTDFKPKYFLVLKVIEGTALLASLPSSKRYLPSVVTITHGCVNIPEASICCFLFAAGRPVLTNNWAFPLPTYVYGTHIDEYEIAILNDKYPTEGIDYEIIGNLTEEEYKRLLKCFRASTSIKRKYKKLL